MAELPTKKQKRSKRTGLCALTRRRGLYVKSHLIPKALTRPAYAGASFTEAGMGRRPITRFDSWYDNGLVTRLGEDILSAIDNWAIDFLRTERMVWSGRDDDDVPGVHLFTPEHGLGIRKIAVAEPEKLRRFFLSLLWRAAATARPEFSEVQIPADDLERLRRYLLGDEKLPIGFYPATLTQIPDRGEPHNLVPLAQVKHVPDPDGGKPRQERIFRFYLDGIVVHILREPMREHVPDPSPLVVGAQDELVITIVPWTESFELKNLVTVMMESAG